VNNKVRLIVLRVKDCTPRGLLAGLAYWDLVPIRDRHDRVREVLLTAIKPGRHKDDAPASAPYWRASRAAPTSCARSGTHSERAIRLRSLSRRRFTASAASANPPWHANSPIRHETATRVSGSSTPNGRRTANPGTRWRRVSSISAASSFLAATGSRIVPPPHVKHWISSPIAASSSPGCSSTTTSMTQPGCVNGRRSQMQAFY